MLSLSLNSQQLHGHQLKQCVLSQRHIQLYFILFKKAQVRPEPYLCIKNCPELGPNLSMVSGPVGLAALL